MLKQWLRSVLGAHRIAAAKRLPVIRQFFDFVAWRDWKSRAFAMPAPPFVKRAAIRRNSIHGATFVESGTFLGDTAIEAARYSKHVVTVEASAQLCDGLRQRFRPYQNIALVEGRSQDVFPMVLQDIGGKVTFWLDAHASGGIAYGDDEVTSIVSELSSIAASLDRFEDIVVMVDDIRGFGASSHYPDVEFLIRWGHDNGMSWTIELDMMCLRRQRRSETASK